MHFGGALSQGVSIAGLRLDAHFARFHRSQCNISEKFSAGRSGQINWRSPQICILLLTRPEQTTAVITNKYAKIHVLGQSLQIFFVATHLSKHVIVQALKDFIETELAKALHGVTNECWSPPFAQTPKAILSQGHWEAIEDGLVLIRVHLEENRNNAFPKVCLQTPSKQVGHFFSFCTYSFNVTLEK